MKKLLLLIVVVAGCFYIYQNRNKVRLSNDPKSVFPMKDGATWTYEVKVGSDPPLYRDAVSSLLPDSSIFVETVSGKFDLPEGRRSFDVSFQARSRKQLPPDMLFQANSEAKIATIHVISDEAHFLGPLKEQYWVLNSPDDVSFELTRVVRATDLDGTLRPGSWIIEPIAVVARHALH